MTIYYVLLKNMTGKKTEPFGGVTQSFKFSIFKLHLKAI